VEINLILKKDNTMHKLKLSAVALCLLLPFGAQAAEERSLEQRVEKKLEKMTEQLGLSAEQQAKVKPLLEAEEARREAERKADEAYKADKRKQLEGILNAEQLSKLDTESKMGRGEGKKRKDKTAE
jgi:hypothetical protein